MKKNQALKSLNAASVQSQKTWKLFPAWVALCGLVLVSLLSTRPVGAQKKDSDLGPLDVTITCLEAFFRGDDLRVRNFLTDNAQVTLANLSTTDARGYDEMRRIVLSGNPLTALAERGVRTEVLTGAGGDRQVFLKNNGRIIGNVTFRETAAEELSLIEAKLFQNEKDGDPTVFQVVLTRNKKKKLWQIASVYTVASGGNVDAYFSLENLTSVRVNANEAAVLQVLRTLQSAEARYLIGPGQTKYGTLADLRRAGEIGTDIESGRFRGYVIEVITDNTAKPPSFAAYAIPAQYGKTGRRSFVIDEGGTLRGADRKGVRATLNDPVIGGEDTTADDR